MKKSLLALVAIGALIASPAMAADLGMPLKAPPAPAVPVFSWTGFYIGANLGGSWGDVPESYGVPIVPLNVTNTAHPDSIIGGGQIGYNYQMNNIVLGVEADIADRSARSDFNCLLSAAISTTSCVSASPSLLTLHDEQNWLGTFRGRLGVTFNRVLLYGTGGLAYGNVEHSVIENQTPVPGAVLTVSDSATRTGWAAGVGAEYAISDTWSVGVEYLHVDLGTDTLASPAALVGGVAFPAATTTFADKSDIVRAKVNYRFNWGGPLATRY